MLQGWTDINPTNWSAAQRAKYMDWSNTVEPQSVPDYSGPTEYAGVEAGGTEVEMTTFVPGQNNVITTTDQAGITFQEEWGTLPTLDDILGNVRNMYPTPETPWKSFDELIKRPTVKQLPSFDELLARAGHPGAGAAIEMQELGVPELGDVVAPRFSEFTRGAIRPFEAASPWSMESKYHFRGNIISDLEDPLSAVPEIDISNIQKLVPLTELQSVFETSLMDVDAFGVGNYNLKALLGGG